MFQMYRLEDESGVSGTGLVAEGVQFETGKCVVGWLTDIHSVAIYDRMEDVEYIHGHDGKTKIGWLT